MKRRVLILCTGNSARSQLAEALVNARLGDTWEAYSAGTQPAAAVNPFALAVLAEVGIQPSGSHPKHISGFIGQPFDVVITVCDEAAEHCLMTTVSMLLKSWASPPVSWPMASIFWAWARAAWVRRCSVTSTECT